MYMQNGKAGSYLWACAGPAAESVPIVKIIMARIRIGASSRADGTAQRSKQTGDFDSSQFTFAREPAQGVV
jgi:hypothetical protein